MASVRLKTENTVCEDWVEIIDLPPDNESMSSSTASITTSDDHITQLLRAANAEMAASKLIQEKCIKNENLLEEGIEMEEVPLKTSSQATIVPKTPECSLTEAQKISQILDENPVISCNPFKHCFKDNFR